jgi:hypothetical protein
MDNKNYCNICKHSFASQTKLKRHILTNTHKKNEKVQQAEHTNIEIKKKCKVDFNSLKSRYEKLQVKYATLSAEFKAMKNAYLQQSSKLYPNKKISPDNRYFLDHIRKTNEANDKNELNPLDQIIINKPLFGKISKFDGTDRKEKLINKQFNNPNNHHDDSDDSGDSDNMDASKDCY